jgi:excisionase family DNA binding protein
MNNKALFLSISQAVDMLGISQSSLLRLLKKGVIPHTKLGKRTLIPREVIDVLVRNAYEQCNVEYPQKDTKH